MEAQTCVGCFVEKPLSDYFNNAIKKNGKDSKCKVCRKLRNKEWSKDNEEKCKSIRKAYYEKTYWDNREKRKIRYQLEHDKILEQKREYVSRTREERKKYLKDYRNRNKDELQILSKLNKRFIIDGVLDLLGPICIDCGELNRHFLTVDHKLNNGNEERHLSSIGWKRRILNGQSNKDDYQILCFNCNLGKYRLNPTNHQKGRQIIGELILCPKCLFEKDRSEFSNDLSKNRSCFECQRFMDTFVKVKTINFVGGKCACCGMSEPHKLTIDHIKGDGWYRRKFLSEGSGVDFYKKILNHTIDSKGFQILCWNCNMSKHINNGVCLHQMLFKSEKLNRNRPTLTKNNNSSENKDFNFINITIIKGSNLQSKKLFKDYHYNKFGRPQTAIYSAILDDKVIAAVKFCTPVRLEVATTLGYEYKDVIELDRFCIHPEYQKKNFASWLMSRVVKQFKTDFPDIKALVSFADTRFGHVGTIYKASNWKELGQTSPSYVYVDLDGNEINKKTLYGYAKRRNMKERECADRLGLKKVPTPPKIKYIYEL